MEIGKPSELSLLIESIIKKRAEQLPIAMRLIECPVLNFFAPKETLIDFISALFRLGLDDSEISDILKFGIDNLKEIRELSVSLKITQEILDEQFGKE